MKPRILVIRGGAIGDFVLTLPAIRLLREAFPRAHLEILGYKHIVALAEARFYADATRSIEYGALSGFFTRNSVLSLELADYFAGFQQIVSYLYDPDGIFEGNLRRAGVKNFLAAYRPIDDSEHAAEQLARPLQELALYLEDHASQIFLSEADRAAANQFLAGSLDRPIVAIHPGSGSPNKNWPLGQWADLGRRVLQERPATRLLLVGGEADHVQIDALSAAWNGLPLIVARELPLPHLAAVIERCQLFVGHDSGISHVAAAVGARCLLLFGPTDPSVWAPSNPAVSVLQAPGGELSAFTAEAVGAKTIELL